MEELKILQKEIKKGVDVEKYVEKRIKELESRKKIRIACG